MKAFADRYRAGRQLARARTGRVQLAIDGETQERVVLKEMPAHLGVPLDEIAEEARRLAAVEHEGLARVHGFERDGVRAWLVMEYVPGRTFDDVLAGEEPIPESRLRVWTRQLCLALEALHERDIFFRGLDPGDVILGVSEHVRLIDFGVGKFRRDGDDTMPLVGDALTAGFAAPEQYVGFTDARSDVHAMGGLLFFLMTGQRPEIADPLAFMDLRRHRRDLSDDFIRVVESMLEVERGRRPKDMRAVMRALDIEDERYAPPRRVVVDRWSGPLSTETARMPLTEEAVIAVAKLEQQAAAGAQVAVPRDEVSEPTGPTPDGSRKDFAKEPSTEIATTGPSDLRAEAPTEAATTAPRDRTEPPTEAPVATASSDDRSLRKEPERHGKTRALQIAALVAGIIIVGFVWRSSRPASRPPSSSVTSTTSSSQPVGSSSDGTKPEPRARLTVASVPSGAQLQVDGVGHGSTPATVDDLPIGPHKLHLEHPATHPLDYTVNLDDGDHPHLTLVLRAQ